VVGRPLRAAGISALAALFLALSAPSAAHAQGKDGGDASNPGNDRGKTGKAENKVFDFTAMDLSGRLRTPQLLYFLDRASEELQRASLERRSFIPEMVRSIDEEPL
jgi:hypothetical protein